MFSNLGYPINDILLELNRCKIIIIDIYDYA